MHNINNSDMEKICKIAHYVLKYKRKEALSLRISRAHADGLQQLLENQTDYIEEKELKCNT